MRERRADTNAGRVKVDEATTPSRAGGVEGKALPRRSSPCSGRRATARRHGCFASRPRPAPDSGAQGGAGGLAPAARLPDGSGRPAASTTSGALLARPRADRDLHHDGAFARRHHRLDERERDSNPVGLIYIVSHANEDGTLSFGVNSQDQDHHMAFLELRDALHPPNGVREHAPDACRHNQADNAIIDIKGCNIGRSPAMLDLLGRPSAAGPPSTRRCTSRSTATTGGSPQQARLQAESLIRSEAERNHPLPDAVDPRLTGAARTRAVRERARLMAERDRAIAAEVRARRPEVTAEMEAQGIFEALSGPEVQQAGTAAIPASEIRADVDRLYPHLSDRQRTQLTRELVRAQRVQSIRPMTYTLAARRRSRTSTLLGPGAGPEPLRRRPDRLRQPRRAGRPGRHHGGGRGAASTNPASRARRQHDPHVGDAERRRHHRDGRGRVANPERLRVGPRGDAAAGGGMLRRAARGRRMRGYLHHRSLDSGPHDHFQHRGWRTWTTSGPRAYRRGALR